ncbi:KpsF/GutQ family sugar-phosphate isomerase [Oricola sp.]|uniref:KpsF/GutQ family sugar-phosphate isomerase n=1 Tax=Oricola sp. TaxID=1979950 RepID=UPI003BA9064E
MSDTARKPMEHAEPVRSALKTLAAGANGLAALESALTNGLGEPFMEAINAISGINGRVIVAGVGKSGHIGSKIAATLASTGTPAFFVHPAEANHGDLGMIARDDAIIAMSWSGETQELSGILRYSRRFEIPLIAITAGADSTLAREADIVLVLPKADEACPHGLAPTTSTLMQLALGDALAVALLESRGFSASDFRTFHPGGKLGANLTHVGEIMRIGSEVPLVATGTPMSTAVHVLAEKRVGCVGVVDQAGLLVGIFTDGDLARNIERDLTGHSVDHIMTTSPKTVTEQTLAASAMDLLNRHNISALIVVKGRKPVGVVHFHDLLRIGVA